MRRYYVLLVVFTVTMLCLPSVFSQPTTPVPEIHCKHFTHGYPLGTPPSNDLIIRDLYSLSSNDSTKFADWVCYRLTPHEVNGSLDLDREWHNDPWLDPIETLEGKPESVDDYEDAHSTHRYDRRRIEGQAFDLALLSFRQSPLRLLPFLISWWMPLLML